MTIMNITVIRARIISGILACASAGFLAGTLLGGCRDITADLPAGTVDPAFYHTADAAYRLARSARFDFQAGLMEAIKTSGGISDELRGSMYGGPVGFYQGVMTEIDSRYLPETRVPRAGRINYRWDQETGTDNGEFAGYRALQYVRASARQARGALTAYAGDSSRVVQGEMLVYEGMAEVLLADLFCSGVPLTTLDFEQDFTYKPGSATADVYRHAIVLFDSALVLGAADARIVAAARVAKGRALLAVGQYAEADAAVASVSTGMRFAVPVMYTAFNDTWLGRGFQSWSILWSATEYDLLSAGNPSFRFASDGEGGNGLPFVSGGDPRVVLRKNTRNNVWGVPDWYPAERTHLTVADHIEARLIQAEAALHADRSEWLTILNTLRTTSTTCTVKTTPSCAATAPAGTGGVAKLPLLTDPALDPLPTGKTAFDIRLDLIMRERAYWLFVTGHRQGDLRRLVREYHRSIESTYPTGTYPGGTGEYHLFIDLPIPEAERLNPYFHGCLGRDA